MEVLSLAKPLSWIGVENICLYPIKEETNLKSKLLKVRHMSRLKFFYLGLPNPVSKPLFLNMCGLHMSEVTTSNVLSHNSSF